MSQKVDVKNITGMARTVKDLFGNKYGLEFYQREYAWTEANVSELINDLTSKFIDEFDITHERKKVASYKPYFLGPVVTSLVDGIRYLVDGQQRLTTLLLFLIHLHHISKEQEYDANLRHLIFSEHYGERTFNIDVPEREQVMHCIFDGSDFELDREKQSESVRNIWEQYNNIEEIFPSDLQGQALPYFIDWLLGRVFLVEIGTTDQNMALEIFETMNDRGLRLSNIDMLKGYLLNKIGDSEQIKEADHLWRKRITELSDLDKNADSDFLKHWLRGHFADTFRERQKGVASGDFDIIGNAFHKWVRDNNTKMGLDTSSEYKNFVNNDFERMSHRYKQLLQASSTISLGFERLFYNATVGITLHYLPIMASITPDDDEETFKLKTNLISSYIDIFLARRIVNFKNFGYSTIVNHMFFLSKAVRQRDPQYVKKVLADEVSNIPDSFDAVRDFRFHGTNKGRIKYMLARITAWIETECGNSNRFSEYVNTKRRNPFEMEHIWANKYERYMDEFDSLDDFARHRNRFGALVLLPKDFNASYGAKPYEEKVEHYGGQNLLVRSLHPLAYENNPSFIRFIERTGLPFKPYPDSFTKSDIEERQDLYRQICEQIWDPDRLGLGGSDE